MADRGPLKGIAQTWARRTLATGRVAASIGVAAAKHVASRAKDRAEDAVADGIAIAARLDELKGLSMKIGQMASTFDGVVPEPIQKALIRLQSESEPLDWEVIEPVLAEAYGRPIGEVFEGFEPVPFAAASIGQVHAARLDGRDVAVKVQYPGVAEAIDIDIGNMRRVGFLNAIGSAIAPGPLMDEMRDRLREECDYLQEAANQAMFAGMYRDDPRIVVPGVFAAHCRTNVLVTERIWGRSFGEFRDTASQADRDRAGLLLFEHAMGSIFAHSAFNADPHPGNYKFLDDGRIAFLDYGCVRVFTADFVEGWKRLARAMLAGDKALAIQRSREVGVVGKSAKFDTDAWYGTLEYLYAPMRTKDFRFTPEFARKAWDVLVLHNPNLRHTAIPPEWLLTNRLQFGLYAILARLGAGGDFAGIFRALVETPSVTASRPPPTKI